MKEYAYELKRISFDLHDRLKKDKALNELIISHYPEKKERLNVIRWDFVKLKFKYFLIQKLNYNFTDIVDLEQYYDEVYELWNIKYLHRKCKNHVCHVEYINDDPNDQPENLNADVLETNEI